MLKIIILATIFFASSACGDKSSEKGPRRIQRSQEENRSLDEIYEAALAEGGKLVVYAGGDAPSQQDGTKLAFEQRFPNITVDIVVDYSKFHDARIDLQLANGTLVPDVAHLQTLQDFPRWKRGGVLMQYKPAGWDKVYADFKDADGYHTGFRVSLFSNLVNSQLMPNESDWPRVATDYLKEQFAGRKLAVTYPNDDDAVLFWFKQTIEKYGWSWFVNFIKQNPIFVRGTQTPSDLIANGTAVATMTSGSANLVQSTEGNLARFSFPANNDPFTTWSQQVAIFKRAKHPETAKLYLNWLLDPSSPSNINGVWSARTDIAPKAGFKQIWEYPNSSHRKFMNFMRDREAVEIFKTQIMLYIGEPQGQPSAGVLGPTPTQSAAH